MDAEFQARREALLDECKDDPRIWDEVLSRLKVFMQPFVEHLVRNEQVAHARTFVCGLLSNLEDKNTESIAYLFNQKRMPLQWFMGVSQWNYRPLREELAQQIGQVLGEPDGVIVFDPSAFPKSGPDSVGVDRQWCGRLGKVENCQVGVYLGYVSRREQALVDTRLYLTKKWTDDAERMKKAGVPAGTTHRTRHQLCLDMLEQHSRVLPHQWIAGDDEMGRPYWFRRDLHDRGEQYLLAVPSETLIRDLEVEPPTKTGRGRIPNRPWQRVDAWLKLRSEQDWTRIDVRDGAKGPLVVEILKRRVTGRTGKRQQGHDEMLVVMRYKDRDDQRVTKTDYYLSDASPDTPLAEFARVAKAEHRIEECFHRSKSEAGLADYESRTWVGWQHHQTLSLIATWFLVQESQRGKKIHSGNYLATNPTGHRVHPAPRVWMRYRITPKMGTRNPLATQRTCPPLSLETA